MKKEQRTKKIYNHRTMYDISNNDSRLCGIFKPA